jgi:hypothetical protein
MNMTQRRLGTWFVSVGLICSLGCGSTDKSGGSPNVAQPGTTGAGQPGAAPGGSQSGSPASGVIIPGQMAAGAGSTPAMPTGTAGKGAPIPPPATSPGGITPPTGPTTAMPVAGAPMAMGECKNPDGTPLHTNYAGDEYCILPPPADKGFQLHIGPSNYANPEPQYILAAGQEITSDFAATSSNDKPIYFYYRQFRQRDGAHHNIITSGGGGDTGLGQRIGTSNNLAEDYPKGGIIAKENEGVGISLPARTSINVSLHSINTSTKPELREVWINFWYRDAAVVTDPVKEVFSIAPQAPIGPGADTIINGSCNVSGSGRMLWMYGHRHANNVRFTVWRNRGAQKDLVYQAYNWEDALVLDYSSTVMNPKPDTGPNVEGGWSGILDIQTGDQFTWECHVINKTQGTLLFSNNTYSGEMCILDAETVGASCN